MSYYFYQAADGSYCNLARASRIYLKTAEEDSDDQLHHGTYTLNTSEPSGIGVYALIDGVEYLLAGNMDQDDENVKIQLRSIMNDLVRAQSR